MKITEQDIIRTARKLRDEENQQLQVRTKFNNGRPHRHFPAWLAAVPAAAVIGFMLGIWTKSNLQNDSPLTAIVDTVYIKVHDEPTTPDTAVHVEVSQKAPTVKRVRHSTAVRHEQKSVSGKPMADDNIRYDLLVKD
ncbi:MAG: hypothetical protein J5506_03940 [Prevotella sp.]|nr:hypothetical protein [Prevotella sp.]